MIRKLVIASWQNVNWLTVLLLPLSLVYWLVFSINKALYAMGLKQVHKVSVPVIVVGNLTVGGTGKTPMVIHLFEQLRDHGYSPGIISRGYQSSAGDDPLIVRPNTPVGRAGDEAAMIVRRTQAPMVVCADRRAACDILLDEFSVDIVISDDGLQHHALARDVEICLIDSTTTQNNKWLLPAGPYREPLSRLDSFDFLVRHQALNNDISTEEKLASNLFSMQLEASAPISLNSLSGIDQQVNEFDATKSIHAVAGIANPRRFFDTCRSLGYTIVENAFADHHAYTEDDLNFGESAQILMTEKDAVKCVEFKNPRHWLLPVDAKLQVGFIEAVVKKLKSIN